MSKIRVTLVKSAIDRAKTQKVTLKTMGLNKVGSFVEKEATPEFIGMVKKVNHLVKTEEI